LTLPEVDGRSPMDGLALYWNPDWERLFSAGAAGIWLAAAGQIFFTLSVGSGAINTYASYLTRDDDITLTGLATVSTNEFCEVVLGGTLAIPAAFVFLGSQGVWEASSGNMGLAFITMPQIFAQTPIFGIEPGPGSVQLLGTLWFGLLFVAGITSSLALSQPTMAFFEDAQEGGHGRRWNHPAVRAAGDLADRCAGRDRLLGGHLRPGSVLDHRGDPVHVDLRRQSGLP
jgi:SNF family Na+-dependent transporter